MQGQDAFEFTQTPPYEDNPVEDPANYRCGNCIACFRIVNCRKCENCFRGETPCLRRICIQIGLANKELKPDLEQSTSIELVRKKGRPSIPKPPKAEKKRGRPIKQDVTKRNPSKPRKPNEQKPARKSVNKSDKSTMLRQATQNSFILENSRQPRHCLGPECIRAARQGSKYCSQECGIALAEQRIAIVLPQRLKEYYSEKPLAEVQADKKLMDLIQKRKEVEEWLQTANEYRENFDCYIKALADKKPSISSNSSNKKQANSEVVTCFCFVCGSEIAVSGSVQHTRRCFERLEKQSSFGTAHKVPVNPFHILCETHDKQTKTYCKRLRVVCPEHYKDDIGKQMKICGFPLMWEKCELKSLEEMLGKNKMFMDGMCGVSRNQCSEHKMWEQNVAALIDNLRMSYLLQIDDLVETYKRIIVACQSHYNGILHLLSVSTPTSPKMNLESNYVEVKIEDKPDEKPTESQLADLHL